jgi:hypothetical protein
MHRPGPVESTLTFVRKFSDMTEYNKYTGAAYAKGLRVVRFEFEGATIGAVDAKETFQLDFVGKYAGPRGAMESRNGILYQQHALKGLYSSDIGAAWEMFHQNSVSQAATVL